MRGIGCLFLALVANLASAYAGFTDATLDLRRLLRREGPEAAIATANARLAELGEREPAVRAELWEIKALALGQVAGNVPTAQQAVSAANATDVDLDRYADILRDRFFEPLSRIIASAWRKAATCRSAAGQGHWAGRDRFLAVMAREPFESRPLHGPGSNDNAEITAAVKEVLASPAPKRQRATLLLQMAYPLACNQRKVLLASTVVRAAGDLVAGDPMERPLLAACALNFEPLRLFSTEDQVPWALNETDDLPRSLALTRLLNDVTTARIRQVETCIMATRGDAGAFQRLPEELLAVKTTFDEFNDSQFALLCERDFLAPRADGEGREVWETTYLFALPVLGSGENPGIQFVPLSLSTGMVSLVRNANLELALRRGFGAFPVSHYGTVFDYAHSLAGLFGALTVNTRTKSEIDLLTKSRSPLQALMQPSTEAELDTALASGATSGEFLRTEQVSQCRNGWSNLPDAVSAKHLYEYARLKQGLLDSTRIDLAAETLTLYDQSFGMDQVKESSPAWESLVRAIDDGGLWLASARYDFEGQGSVSAWVLALHLGLVTETSDLVVQAEARRPFLWADETATPAEHAQAQFRMAEALAAAPWRVMTGPLGRSLAQRQEFALRQIGAFREAGRLRPVSIVASVDIAALASEAASSTTAAKIAIASNRATASVTAAALLEAAQERPTALSYIFETRTTGIAMDAIKHGDSPMADRTEARILAANALIELSLPPLLQSRTIGEVLDPEDALLAFVVGDKDVATIVVRAKAESSSYTMVRTPRSALEPAVLTWVDAVARGSAIDPALAAEVSNRLLPKAVLDAIGDAKTLLVMPQSFLWRVPFGALKVGPVRLYERHNVGFIESLSLLRQIKATAGRQGTGGFLGVGGVDSGLAGSGPLVDTSGLADLSKSSPQADAVRSLLRDEGKNATLEADVKAKLRECRVAHFATHGVVPPAAADHIWSALILQPSGGDDGFLQPAEIFGAGPFPSLDLVTLIACQSGATQDSMGPFNRAFLYSGAQTIVSTQWAIGEDVGDLFTRKFYGILAEDKTSFEAMRAAIDAVRAQYPDEHDWAPYALYGIGTNRPGMRPR